MEGWKDGINIDLMTGKVENQQKQFYSGQPKESTMYGLIKYIFTKGNRFTLYSIYDLIYHLHQEPLTTYRVGLNSKRINFTEFI